MRILYVLEKFPPYLGGVETLFSSLIQKLNISDENSITLVTSRHKLRSSNTDIKIVQIPTTNRYLFTVLAIPVVLIHAFKADFIHTTSYNAAIPSKIASIISRKKLVITFHELWNEQWFELPFISKFSARLHFLFEKYISRFKYEKIIAVSNYTAARLRLSGVEPSRIEVIHNGVPDDLYSLDFKKKNEHNCSFIYFGRAGMSKGIEFIFEAVEIIISKGIDIEVTMIGNFQSSNYGRHLINLVKKKGIGGKVGFIGSLSDEKLNEKLMSCHAVLIPSRMEGFCYAAVESIARQVPIIHSNRAALQEVVSGKHIEMKEFSALGLAEAMESSLGDNWSHTPLRHFLLSDTVSKYQSLYKSILDE